MWHQKSIQNMSKDEKMTQVIVKVPQEYILIIAAEQRCNGYVTIEEIKEVTVQNFRITGELGELDSEDGQSEESSKEGKVALNVVKKTLQAGNIEQQTN